MGRSITLAMTCGVASIVGGLVAVAAGLAGALPDAGPTFQPSALGVALAGAALLFSGRPGAARLFGALAAAVGGVVLAVALGEGAAEAVPRSAVVLFAIGVGLLLAHTRAAPLADALGLVAGAMAAGALVAELTEVRGEADGLLVSASAVEACGWLVLAVGLLLAREPRPPRASPSWRPPVIAGIASAVLSVLLFQALAIREEDQLAAMLEVGSERIRGDLAAELRQRTYALSLLATEWEGRILRLRGLWESDVRLVLSRSPGLVAIEWIDPNGAVGWTYPEGAGLAAPAVLPSGSGLGRPLPFALGPFRRSEGRYAFRLLAPVSRTDPDEGWLSGVFHARELFDDVARQLPEGWVVAVHAGEVELHRSPAPDARWVAGRVTQQPLEVFRGLSLQLSVGASPELVAQRRSRLPHTVLFTGLFLSLLLSLTLRLWLVSRGLARELESRVSERTASLARSNEGLRSFASFLSHELRQPIHAQALWTDLLESDYAPALDEQGRRGISEVRRLARRMGDLIEGQLALFAVSSAEVKFGPVDLDALLDEVTGDLKVEIDRTRASIRWEGLPVVRGDARQLHQLFRNLVDNSLKYRQPGSPPAVRIAARRFVTGDEAEIVYLDEGRGFPDGASERIFQIGERLGGGGPGGHGLGLAMCRAIVERHGGTIVAEGRPGVGATFRITLPLALHPLDG